MNSHYCLIRNFSRLMAHRTNRKCQHHYCYNCLHGFTARRRLENHTPLCQRQQAQRIEFPEKNKMVKFKSIQKQLRMPFVTYADFELHREDCGTTQKPRSFKHNSIPASQQKLPQHVSILVCIFAITLWGIIL